ncbi:MAG: PKD domain-containing protein [Actinomycetota bacterium]
MRRVGIAVLLALALACISVPLRAAPLLGSMQVTLSWSPGNPTHGSNVTFTGSAISNDGTVIEATLCFGDGTPCSTIVETPSTIEEVTACVLGGPEWSYRWDHTFARTGRYTVSFSVTSQGCPGLSDSSQSYRATVNVS